MFHIGQKVVCIDDSVPPYYKGNDTNPLGGLKKGNVYTIRGIIDHYDDWSQEWHLCVFLEELIRLCKIRKEDAPFNIKRFRPLIEKKTDISVFTNLLVPTEKVLEDA